MIHTRIFYGQNISSNFLGRISCRSLVSRALWNRESCGPKVILCEWRSHRILRHGYSKINQYSQKVLRLLTGMFIEIQHRIQHSSSLLHKDGKQSSVMFLCRPGFKLCILLGAVNIWTYYSFSSSFSTKSLNFQSELSHSSPILFNLWGLAHAFSLPTKSLLLSP